MPGLGSSPESNPTRPGKPWARPGQLIGLAWAQGSGFRFGGPWAWGLGLNLDVKLYSTNSHPPMMTHPFQCFQRMILLLHLRHSPLTSTRTTATSTVFPVMRMMSPLESHQDLRKVSYIITTPIQATNPLPCHIVGNKRVCTNPATNQPVDSGPSGDVGPSNGKCYAEDISSTKVVLYRSSSGRCSQRDATS